MSAADEEPDVDEIEKIRAELAELRRRKDILDAIPPKDRRVAKKSAQTDKSSSKETDLIAGVDAGGDDDDNGGNDNDNTNNNATTTGGSTKSPPAGKQRRTVKTTKKPKKTQASKAVSKRTAADRSRNAAVASGNTDLAGDDDGGDGKPSNTAKPTAARSKKTAKTTAKKPAKKDSDASAGSKKTAKTTTATTTAKKAAKGTADKRGGKSAKTGVKKDTTTGSKRNAAVKPKSTKKDSKKPTTTKKVTSTKSTKKATKADSADGGSKVPKVPELTLEEKLESELTEEEIERFQIEKVNMEQLIRKVCDILAEHESTGMLQADLWKKLKLSDMIGSRLALKLERMGTITREKLLENDRWTYKLVLKKTPISTQSIEDAPCLVCPVEQKCTLDGEISPRTCQYIEDWVSSAMKKSRSK